jgi:hypothetical protein
MPRRHYRRQDNSLVGLIGHIVNRPTQNQSISMQYMTGLTTRRPDELRARELEELAANVFYRLGYKNVTHTGGHSSTDGGVDVWMLNDQGLPEIVQCKQLRNRIDKTEMVYFSKVMRRQHAIKGHYWAPSGFTQPAIDYAKLNNIELYEELQIRRLVEKIYQYDLEQKKLQEAQAQAQGKLPVYTDLKTVPEARIKSKRYLGMTVTQIVILATLGFCSILSFVIVFLYLFSIYNH